MLKATAYLKPHKYRADNAPYNNFKSGGTKTAYTGDSPNDNTTYAMASSYLSNEHS